MSFRKTIENMSEVNRQRKKDHLDVVLNEDVACERITTGLDQYRFIHKALPEINLDIIDLSTSIFGKKLSAPLLISPMIGGIEDAARINRNLAQAAQATGIAMGVGSQRCAIEDQALSTTYQVRDIAPDILLFANLGAVQLNYSYGVAECQKAVEMIAADGLTLHLNPLHEALQQEGNTNFAGILEKIHQICSELNVPIIIKEVGFGISEEVARELAKAGVAAIDVAGAGGTSWSEIEKHRATTNTHKAIAATFGSWGIPTADSILMTKSGAPNTPLFASGGICTGLDVAKAIALGADVAGIATPLLKAANISAEAAIETLEIIIKELKICMFCIGVSQIEELKHSPALQKVSE